MACIKPDGTLTVLARDLLEAARRETDENRLVQDLSLPLYRIRSVIREMSGYGYLDSTQHGIILTDTGLEKLEFTNAQQQ
ncbi:hypothetical protein [Desulfovibrio inopinatus]|uniref:hypothetical protein n=1 Tax=Desulfovibrio inopinatus TaxID=102109 RepID=UPI00040C4F3D|nr:hypothetical protein [Desulfovibrio inopinatus]